MKKVRLLHVIGSIAPASGGPIEGIIRQNEATQDRATREILTLDPPDAPFLDGFPIKVHALGNPRRGGLWSLLDYYRYSAKLVPWLRENGGDYDAIIVNGLWNYSASGASIALKNSRTPYFVFTHGMMDPWFRDRYPVKHLAKQIFWLFFEGRLLAGARSVLFTSEEERRLARGVFWGHDRYAETVVGYGAAEPPPPTPAQTQALHAAIPGLGGRHFLLFLSRIHPKKGCDLLVGAFARTAGAHPELDLVIAGPDQVGWHSELKALAERLGVEKRVHFPGGLFGDAKWGALRAADAFILPSHQENFGIAVAEALGCGTPVLISDKVNIWREIEAAGAGLVAPDDLAGTQALLQGWFAMDTAARSAMGDAAREIFQTSFNVNQTAPALLRTIESQL